MPKRKLATRLRAGRGSLVGAGAIASAGEISLVTTAITVNEGGQFTITAHRAVGTQGAVAVDWTISGVPGQSPLTGTFAWAAGDAANKSTTQTATLVTASVTGAVTLSNARRTDGGLTQPVLVAPTSGTLTVNNVVTNQAPVWTNPPASLTFPATGGSYNFSAHASDPEGAALNYMLVGAPTGYQIGSTTGILAVSGSATTNPVTIRVTDGALSADHPCNVTVQAAGVIQSLRPISDITKTGITGGYVDIDEQTFSDTDFAWGANNTAAVLVCGLSVAQPPVAGTCVMRFRVAKVNNGALSSTGNSVIGYGSIYQGTMLIAAMPGVGLTGTWSSLSFNFATSLVTDWSALRFRFETSASGGATSVRRGGAISWMVLEVPEAAQVVNQAPQWVSAPAALSFTSGVGGSYDFAQHGFDPDGDTLSYTLQGTQYTGITLTTAGLLQVSAEASAAVRALTVRVSDGQLSVDHDFTLTVQASSSAWPTQNPPYLSVLPATAGFGMDQFGGSGRHTSGNTAIMFVNSLSPGYVQTSWDSTTRIGYGSLDWCLNYDHGLPRVVIPLVSGRIKFTPTASGPYLLRMRRQYTTLAMHLAPAPGLYLENCYILSQPPVFPDANAGTFDRHHLLMHVGLFQAADNGGASDYSRYGTAFVNVGRKAAWVHCAAAWNKDEGMFFGGSNTGEETSHVSFIHGAILQPLGDPTDYTNSTRYPKNASKGTHSDYGSQYTDMQRSAILFASQRLPLSRCQQQTMANNVFAGATGTWSAYSSFPVGQSRSRAMKINHVGNLYATWPSPWTAPWRKPIWFLSTFYTDNYWRDDSTFFAPNVTDQTYGNRHLYWRSPCASEADIINNDQYASLVGQQSSPITEAWPFGMNVASLSPNGADDRIPFAKRVCDWAGPRPNNRDPVFASIYNAAMHRINGNTTGLTIPPANGAEAQAILDANPVAQNSISSPFSGQATWGGASVPNATRNSVYTTGTFSNGVSRIGYTELEGFIYEQHLRLMP